MGRSYWLEGLGQGLDNMQKSALPWAGFAANLVRGNQQGERADEALQQHGQLSREQMAEKAFEARINEQAKSAAEQARNEREAAKLESEKGLNKSRAALYDAEAAYKGRLPHDPPWHGFRPPNPYGGGTPRVDLDRDRARAATIKNALERANEIYSKAGNNPLVRIEDIERGAGVTPEDKAWYQQNTGLVPAGYMPKTQTRTGMVGDKEVNTTTTTGVGSPTFGVITPQPGNFADDETVDDTPRTAAPAPVAAPSASPGMQQIQEALKAARAAGDMAEIQRLMKIAEGM